MKTKYIVLATIFFSVSINAAMAATNYLIPTEPVLAPFAHTQFCLRYPDDCKKTNEMDAIKMVPLTPARRAELDEVNTDVNRSIVSQVQHEPVAKEQWLIAPAFGDCNDYAVTKRHELLAKRWPSHALLLAEVALPSGAHHLLLIVRTSEGDLVLDSLKPMVRTVAKAAADYKWVRMESDHNPEFWNKVGEPT